MKAGYIVRVGLMSIGLTANLWGAEMSDHNVVWDTPSKNEHGSMPIGNGDLAANVWVEPNGDLVFYISKSDAWSGNGRLLKLGRVRVRTEPAFLSSGATFKQELDLETGTIRIQSTINNKTSTFSFWIDANRPIIHVEIESAKPVAVTAELELWRTVRRELKGQETHSACGIKASKKGGARSVFVETDTVLPAKKNMIRWYHRNDKSCYEITLKNQHLGDLLAKTSDPLINNTFGGSISCDGMVSRDDTTLVTKNPARNLHIEIHAHVEQTDTAEEWIAALDEICADSDNVSLNKARKSHEKQWHEFWDRSWIVAKDKQTHALPINSHPWRVGVDSCGTSRFGGSIAEGRIIGHALSSKEIARLAELPQSSETEFSQEPLIDGCTAVAWIKPAAGEKGRILDKCTAGKPDGITFDTYPGLSLRWIVGSNTMIQQKCLKPGVWQHVAATVETETGVRSLYINGKLIKEEYKSGDSDADVVTRAYVLQRWIQACAGRGKYPIKFNGSLFTVAGSDKGKWDADYRRWGGCYWFQNTRLAYWPMLCSGDFGQMEPFWRMYRDALPLLKERTKAYYNHDGIFCSETMYFWGTYNNANFGWGNKNVHTVNSYIRYYWDSGNELSMMMLDYYHYTQDAEFVKTTLLPIADAVVTFYDQHYKRNAEGEIHFTPAMSLETWHVAEDPLPIIVGLDSVLSGLIDLPGNLTTEMQRKRWLRLRGELPDLTLKTENGKTRLLPARTYSQKKNTENPELYSVFPYRAYTMHKPDLDVALETWKRRLVKRTGGWTQDPIQAALLGLTDQAKAYVVSNAKKKHSGSRFPAFWGPNFDWIPDQDHGSVTMIALQRMLMQCEDEKIYLLPAWPNE